MIIICIAHSDGPKNRSQSKFNGKVQTTLHYSEVRAHAVGEAYEAFVQMHKDMNPPNISATSGGRQAGPGLGGLDAQQLAAKYGVRPEAVQAYVSKGVEKWL